MKTCPVCMAPYDKHPKGEVIITRLDGSVVNFPKWQQLVKEEEDAKKLEKRVNGPRPTH